MPISTEAREEAKRAAYYAGRSDHWNRDPGRTYPDAELQAKYNWGRESAGMDDALDADRKWG